MTANNLEVLALTTSPTSNTKDDEYSIPLNISDIINICREFNKLGWQIQNQVENILELGIDESIKSGNVKRESLPHIKFFLEQIIKNSYFGDAVLQAEECIFMIRKFQDENVFHTNLN